MESPLKLTVASILPWFTPAFAEDTTTSVTPLSEVPGAPLSSTYSLMSVPDGSETRSSLMRSAGGDAPLRQVPVAIVTQPASHVVSQQVGSVMQTALQQSVSEQPAVSTAT